LTLADLYVIFSLTRGKFSHGFSEKYAKYGRPTAGTQIVPSDKT
jgi:hypothetical protein